MSALKRSRQDTFEEAIPVKRQRRSPPTLTSFSNEILLHIFSFLTVQDVCASQLLNKRLANLATDALLWKHLYRQGFPTRSLQSNNRVGESTKKRKKRLGTIVDQDHERASGIDWRRRYRVRSNWSIGRCHTTNEAIPSDAHRYDKTVQGRHFTIQGNKVSWEGTSLSMPDQDVINDIVTAGPDRVLLSTQSHVYLVKVDPFRIEKCMAANDPIQIVQHSDFIALLTRSNKLLIYDILSHVPQCITTLQGPFSSVNDGAALHGRSMGSDQTVIGLAFPEHGILSTSMRLQEVILCNASRTVIHTRLATSPAHPVSYFGSREEADGEITPVRPVYDHPFLLYPTSNHIMIYVIQSTPTEVSIHSGKRLFGHASAVHSCMMNKSLRMAVGLSRGGQLRVWDIHCDGFMGIEPRDRHHGHDCESRRGVIQQVSESRIVVVDSDLGDVTVHDFGI